MPGPTPPADILKFWQEAGAARWFRSDPLFDAEIAIRFGADVGLARKKLAQGPHAWERSARSALALLLLTDQFPRNIYRGLTAAFDGDEAALAVARRAIGAAQDREMGPDLRIFFYLPFTHSEDADDQARCVELVRAAYGEGAYLRHALAHQRIIAKFGRFPTRNAVLGRASGFMEREWLRLGGYGYELEQEAA